MDLRVLLVGPGSRSAMSADDFRKLGVDAGLEPVASLSEIAREAPGDFVLVVECGRRLDRDLFERIWARGREAEIVLASRYLRGGSTAGSFPAAVVTRRTNQMVQRLLRLPCYDPTTPIRLFHGPCLRKMLGGEPYHPLRVLVKLHNEGFKIREVAFQETGSRSLVRALAEFRTHLVSLPRLLRLRSTAGAADADDLAFESRLPWRRRRQSRRQSTIVSFLEVDVPVLDVGCGSSRLIQTLSRGTGVDRDRRKLRFLRGRARAAVAGELPRLPFRSGSFPQIVCSDVVRELAPGCPYLPELRRVLSSRGTLVLATTLVGGTTEASLQEELRSSGFAIDDLRKLPGGEIVVRAVVRELPA